MQTIQIIFYFLFIKYCISDNVVVDTLYGKIKGFTYDMPNSVRANIFLGIPFAKPPVDDLRLEKPEPPTPWNGIKDALSFGPSCTPHLRSAIVEPHSEDCLYINVMAPSKESTEFAGYAVMVWIHGGGFSIGTARTYGYKNISENFVSRDIVFVTIQYRLGPYGFLSTGDSVLPGNLGFWDQRAALRFIRENIASFGGDPNKITIFGSSAGGASVNALSISPHTRALFAQGIEISGSILSPWASGNEVIQVTKDLARELKCKSDNSEKMKQCLKTKSEKDILNAVDKTGGSRYGFNKSKYTPLIDGDFFPEDYEVLVIESPKKPTIIGLHEKEAIFYTTQGNLKAINKLYIDPDKFEQFGEDDLFKFIDNFIANKKYFGDKTKEVRDKVIKHYLNKKESPNKDYKFYLEVYTKIISDIHSNMGIIRMKDLKMKDDWPVWLYLNNYYNKDAFTDKDPVKGATHLDEYPYLFGVSPYKKFEFNDEDRKVQKAMLDTFTQFAKFGSPSNDDYKWEPVDKDHPLRHFRFASKSKTYQRFMENDIKFWESMQKYDFDIIRGAFINRFSKKDEL